jgi:tetratricopeptide (TPR) repeat protein
MRRLSFVILIIVFLPLTAFAEDITKCKAGWNATQSGNHLGAIALFDECIKDGKLSDASLARTYRNIGIAYRRAKEPKKAISVYNKAIAMNPEDVADDYINRGNAYDEANMFKEAIADYDKALELKPEYGEVFYNRGITYEHQNMINKAKAEFISAYEHGLRTRLLYERLVVYGLVKPEQ